MIPRGVSDLKWRAAIALVLGAIGAPRGKDGRIQHRKVSSRGLRRVRSQSTKHRFRFPTRASARLCKGNATAEVVASHGHNKDGKGLVEIYRVARKTLGGAGVSAEVGAARALGRSGSGPADSAAWDPKGPKGSDCLGYGGTNATLKERAQLQKCDLRGAYLVKPTSGKPTSSTPTSPAPPGSKAPTAGGPAGTPADIPCPGDFWSTRYRSRAWAPGISGDLQRFVTGPTLS